MATETRKMYDAEKVVYDALIENGYPSNSIVIEGKLDAKRYADFIVNDLDTGLPVMMIEVKFYSEKTLQSVKSITFNYLKNNFERYKKPIKAVAAFIDRSTKHIEFIDYTDAIKENNFESAIENYSLPKYELLTQGSKSKLVKNQENNQKNKIGILKIICWIIFPIVGFLLLTLDGIGVYEFTGYRLSVFGALAISALIPCFKEITIGEISLKNAIERQREEKEQRDK